MASGRWPVPWRRIWQRLSKLKMHLPFDPAIPLSGIYPQTFLHFWAKVYGQGYSSQQRTENTPKIHHRGLMNWVMATETYVSISGLNSCHSSPLASLQLPWPPCCPSNIPDRLLHPHLPPLPEPFFPQIPACPLLHFWGRQLQGWPNNPPASCPSRPCGAPSP